MTKLHELSVPELCDNLIGKAKDLRVALIYQQHDDIRSWYEEIVESANLATGPQSALLQVAEAFFNGSLNGKENLRTPLPLHYWELVQDVRQTAKGMDAPSWYMSGNLGITILEAKDHLKKFPLGDP